MVNATNRASIDLHREFGLHEVTRDFDFPGICFTGGEGVLLAGDGSPLAEQVIDHNPGICFC